ncbi:TolC family protein [Sphingomonas sp. 35-24ZXX]|uniref:TolC family protein n=1 Tax=Sphingomonas sp. 35-24ZXX TaxID=1545915 RepID=UPI0012E081FB|nr:TolC family protein [Sphingomonas sp. 35-24ZXX]
MRAIAASTVLLVLLVHAGMSSARAQPVSLPAPVSDPLAMDLDTDPLLAIEREVAEKTAFRALLAQALEANPSIREAEARNLEAVAGRNVARSGQLPAGELSVSSFRTLSREFSNDPQNIIERSRARQRTDATISLAQPLFDFGASADRIAAAQQRVAGSEARFAATAEDIGLRAVAAWYELFAMRTLVALGEALDASQQTLGEAIDRRIEEGVAARSDRVRIDGAIAQSQARLAGYRRGQAGAEARFGELLGPPPPTLLRAPVAIALADLQGDQLEQTADSAPIVRAARADADAAARDAEAVRADLFPTVSASIEAGRYGVFETDIDYDVRARLNVRLRLFGGGDARADQAAARAMADGARADRIRQEALRDIRVAASDVRALELQLTALRNSYVAAKISRDVLVERFRVARGSLFDVLSAEDAYFATATAYVQAIVDLDIARYVLLARTGQLLPALGFDRLSPSTWDSVR